MNICPFCHKELPHDTTRCENSTETREVELFELHAEWLRDYFALPLDEQQPWSTPEN